jgi:hypothetical protein
MNKYMQEFNRLKPYDKCQYSAVIEPGYEFITTAGHGYLVVPMDDKNIDKAIKADTGYGFIGKLARYLEEDCEVSNFINLLEGK